MFSRVTKKMLWLVPEVKAGEWKGLNTLGSWHGWTQLFVIRALGLLTWATWLSKSYASYAGTLQDLCKLCCYHSYT